MFPPAGTQPPHDPAALARAILAQPRFRVQTASAPQHTWWGDLRRWMAHELHRLMDAFSRHVQVGPGVGVAVGDLLAGILIVLVLVVGVRLLLSAARVSAPPRGTVSALPEHPDAAALFETAQQAAYAGAYAAAIAFAFRAVLALLDARGALRDDPARTVNECRRDVRARAPRLSGSFEIIARAFTAAVYAEDRVGPDQWTHVERAYRTFTAQSDGT